MSRLQEAHLTVEFVNTSAHFRKLLETTFPREAVKLRSVFLGAEVVILEGAQTDDFAEKLATCLLAARQLGYLPSTAIKVGRRRMGLRGLAADDVGTTKRKIMKLIEIG